MGVRTEGVNEEETEAEAGQQEETEEYQKTVNLVRSLSSIWILQSVNHWLLIGRPGGMDTDARSKNKENKIENDSWFDAFFCCWQYLCTVLWFIGRTDGELRMRFVFLIARESSRRRLIDGPQTEGAPHFNEKCETFANCDFCELKLFAHCGFCELRLLRIANFANCEFREFQV